MRYLLKGEEYDNRNDAIMAQFRLWRDTDIWYWGVETAELNPKAPLGVVVVSGRVEVARAEITSVIGSPVNLSNKLHPLWKLKSLGMTCLPCMERCNEELFFRMFAQLVEWLGGDNGRYQINMPNGYILVIVDANVSRDDLLSYRVGDANFISYTDAVSYNEERRLSEIHNYSLFRVSCPSKFKVLNILVCSGDIRKAWEVAEVTLGTRYVLDEHMNLVEYLVLDRETISQSQFDELYPRSKRSRGRKYVGSVLIIDDVTEEENKNEV